MDLENGVSPRLQYLERHGSSLRLGLALFELGQLAATPKQLRKRAIGIMADLRNATGQTVHLAVLDGVEVVYIEILRGRGVPLLPSRVGGRMPAYAAAVGKAMIAFSPTEVLEDVFANGLQQISPGTTMDEDSLGKELADMKSTGLAREKNESAIGSVCIASAVMDAGRVLVAALSVSGSVGHLNVDHVAPAVRTAALPLGRQPLRNSALRES